MGGFTPTELSVGGRPRAFSGPIVHTHAMVTAHKTTRAIASLLSKTTSKGANYLALTPHRANRIILGWMLLISWTVRPNVTGSAELRRTSGEERQKSLE